MSNAINSSNSSNASSASNPSSATSTSDSKATTSSDLSQADTDGGQPGRPMGQPDAVILQQGKLFRSLMAAPGESERRSEVAARGGLLPAREDDEDNDGSDLGGLGNGLHRGD